MYRIKHRDVLTKIGDDTILFLLGDQLGHLDEPEEALHHINDTVPIIIDIVHGLDGRSEVPVSEGQHILLILGRIDTTQFDTSINGYGPPQGPNLLHMVDEGPDRMFTVLQEEILGILGHHELVISDNLLIQLFDLGFRGGLDTNNMHTGLEALDHLLNIRTHREEMDIMAVLIDIVTKDLLTLLVHRVDIVNNHHLLLTENGTMRLTECFEFTSEEADPLLFQIVHIENIVFRNRLIRLELVILTNEGMEKDGFTRTGITDEEDVEVVHLQEGLEDRLELMGGEEPVEGIWFVLTDEEGVGIGGLHGCVVVVVLWWLCCGVVCCGVLCLHRFGWVSGVSTLVKSVL